MAVKERCWVRTFVAVCLKSMVLARPVGPGHFQMPERGVWNGAVLVRDLGLMQVPLTTKESLIAMLAFL